jgi:hypothetical protein
VTSPSGQTQNFPAQNLLSVLCNYLKNLDFKFMFFFVWKKALR